MARIKNPPLELVADAALACDLDENLNALSQHQTRIMQQYGEGLPYERDRIIHEARFYMAQSAEAMLEAGKRLVILKENEPHGTFTTIVENELGLAPQVARRMMQASVKFLGYGDGSQPKRSSLRVLGKTKLYELMVLDDDDLDQLAEGGTVAGATLDEIDRMTSRELKAALRESRENSAAQQRVLADKNSKIDELATRLEKKSRIATPEPDPQSAQLRAEVSAIAFDAEAHLLGKLQAGFSELLNSHDALQSPPTEFMNGLLCQLERAIHQLRERFFLDEAPNASLKPAWLDAPEPRLPHTETV
ncbi:DUF3102 domain-containing protein [Lonsdalea quercina]|uniref:DUF3102 domain-containing protein n=1 Tax=Lonsdalea quercina TaxID=71657 RepID=UPI00397481D4